jgi:cyclohexanone monooxygenase
MRSQALPEEPALPETTTACPAREFDVIVIGAGFAGMHALYALRDDYRVRAFEAGSGVGGTWYWNRYPGARCDVESIVYSYTFSEALYREWSWTERYATQPEIERYANWVADRLGLRRDIQFDTRVTRAQFDERDSRWVVDTDRGDRVSARYLVCAVGCLSATNLPDFAGLDDFEGEAHHTSRWPEAGVDVTGKRVALIGTGSSGVQAAPVLAEAATHLTVFQRTPNFSVPAGQVKIDPAVAADRKANLAGWRREADEASWGVPTHGTGRSALDDSPAELHAELQRRWELGGPLPMLLAYNDVLLSDEANARVADFVRDKIRATVKDPETAERLCPKELPFGAKRLCVDTNYYETYNRDNVSLIDVRSTPIQTITPKGLRLADGQEHEFDVIVFATGFDAMTGGLTRIDIRGRQGRSLKQAWQEGPGTYLGIQTAGFPNLFMITGPGSPSVISNMLLGIEQHVDFIVGCLHYLQRSVIDTIEPDSEAQDSWMAKVNEIASHSVLPKAASWFNGANIPGKARQFMIYAGGWPAYRAACDNAVQDDYRGFITTAAAASRA